jgi:hypothetical protein
VKAIALVLLCSCAPTIPAPSSLWVEIDRSIDGSKCSRSAAETIAIKRQQERNEWIKRQIECEGRVSSANAETKTYKASADRGAWWQQYGLGLTIGALISGLGLGFGIGFATAK